MSEARLEVEYLPLTEISAYARNSRQHSDEQVEAIARSIKTYGFNNPILIDAGGVIIAGHGRALAAESLGMDTVPCLRLSHLNDAQRRAYVIADNRMSELGAWDSALLASEVESLLTDSSADIDISDLGFSVDDFAGLGLSGDVLGALDDVAEGGDEPTADDYADIGQGASGDGDSKAITYPVILQLDKRTWQAWRRYKGQRRDSEAFSDLVALIDGGDV